MADAPRDGTDILLWTTCYGIVQARFHPGSWSEDTPLGPAEYDGALWVCADDQFQIEVEEYGADCPHGAYGDGCAKAWDCVPSPPPADMTEEATDA